VDNLATRSERFTAETSKATGKDERTIRRAAARGEALGDDLGAMQERLKNGEFQFEASSPVRLKADDARLRDAGHGGELSLIYPKLFTCPAPEAGRDCEIIPFHCRLSMSSNEMVKSPNVSRGAPATIRAMISLAA
jgi:hypothetical protein